MVFFENLNINTNTIIFELPPEFIYLMKVRKYFIKLFFDNPDNNTVNSKPIFLLYLREL